VDARGARCRSFSAMVRSAGLAMLPCALPAPLPPPHCR
jgi:hypothetical protein